MRLAILIVSYITLAIGLFASLGIGILIAEGDTTDIGYNIVGIMTYLTISTLNIIYFNTHEEAK